MLLLIAMCWIIASKSKSQRFVVVESNKKNYIKKKKDILTHSCWSDDGDALLIGYLNDLPGVGFGDAFRYDGDGMNLNN